MNRLLGGACAVVFALLAAAPAHAGDYQGLYIGFNLGAVTGSSNAKTSTIFCPGVGCYFATTSVPAIAAVGAQNLNSNSFAGGALLGFNVQHHHLVFGGEADFGSMRLNKTQTGTSPYPCCPTTSFTITQSLKTSYLFTVRPRLGWTAGPALFYGTGGLGVTNGNYQALFTDTFATAHENGAPGLQNGWVAGGGVEVKLQQHWSLKGEVLHSDFGSSTVTSTNLTAFGPPVVPFPGNVFTHTVSLTTNNYRFGVNFHF
jgi:outer membrane immunogenic protein